MAWSTPPVWAIVQMVTSTQLNTLSSNLNETAVAKATSPGSHFAATGVNSVAERILVSDFITNTNSTTSTSYVNLAVTGPTVTTTCGAKALVMATAGMFNNLANAESFASVDVTGATTSPPDDVRALRLTSATVNAQAMMSWCYVYAMTAGSSTFTLKYHVSSSTSWFFDRRISVVPF
jgi:hypothetical protein